MPLSTDHLLQLVRRKHDYLVQLRELGAQQCAVVGAGEVGDLLRLLGAKQQVILQLQELERELIPYSAEEPESRVWRSGEERQACARLVAACDEMFRTILDHEREAEEVLRRRRDETVGRLREAHAAEEARTAYLPEAGYQPGALDLTSEV